MANLVEQFFPEQSKSKITDKIIDQILMVCAFYKTPKHEIMEYEIPEFIIMRNYAVKSMNEETKRWNKILGAGSRR